MSDPAETEALPRSTSLTNNRKINSFQNKYPFWKEQIINIYSLIYKYV